VDPFTNKYSPNEAIDLYDRMSGRIGAVPGVTSVTSSRFILLSGSASNGPIAIPGQDDVSRLGARNSVYQEMVRANFLNAMEIPILRGRCLDSGDRQNSPKVAVINEALARRFFPAVDPIGKHFVFPLQRNQEIEIVGIARDAKLHDVRAEAPPTVYLPYLQNEITPMAFEVRTATDPSAVMPLVREAVRQVDEHLPMIGLNTQSEQINARLFGERLFAHFTGVFGLIALLLACIGLYGLMLYNVTRRTNEIGIRMALGAQRTNVLQLVMRESLLLVLIGAAIGVLGALAVTRVLANMLYGLAPHDPTTILIAVAMLILFATLAAYIPARRASKVDPIIALRYE
jgi:predicted permease